ncbi:phosphoribosylglycinamide formyltransferase [candidate division NPL-UPA2 bacterium Unc8]|uniref:Phosphoribosylglycinamide formyltransferase n=1 Tax=candidate division NPL-UPA2 bacterium Unc8 TaxID=1980939 RepID=A0A399G098_UNCN2|nr:Phosphoribosylglycinamide formyltransferase [Bacillota bacterium]MBT9147370.1 Phosphoribosylglycinamide formyltransferase [Bacillota bacterium]RII01020.1 MAG: phosphoribosylglycinamide formyltransferase [candidate division NPL-UPA2 bacterium Unc8]
MAKLNLGVLLSGNGRTLQNIINRIKKGELPAQVRVVVSSREDAGGVVIAKKEGIDVFVVSPQQLRGDTFSEKIASILSKYEIDLVIMAGFLHFFKISEKYQGKVLNIHPALIPSFCGKGYYGHYVHEAVLKSGVKISGCTVHFADNTYDNGPIILQKTVPVMDDDTPQTLAERVFTAECEAYPEAIQLFARGRLKIVGGKTLILEE